MYLRTKVAWSVGILLAALGVAFTASAEPASLRDFLFGGANRPSTDVALPAIGRYQGERGESFVLDRLDGRRAVLKFDDSSELWALTASPGPRGDVIYRNDMGEAVLRATRLGGLTLFPPGDPMGMAAASVGVAQPLRGPVVYGPEALLQVLIQASGRASRAAQHLIIFDASDAVATPATEPVFADAFLLTADAIVRVTSRTGGRAAVTRLGKVHFVQGADAQAVLVGRMIQITIAPELGVAGRPSSQRIAAVLSRH